MRFVLNLRPLSAVMLAGIVAGLAPFPCATAQPVKAAEPSLPGGFDEIIVTARKRPEILQQVPIAIDSFSQADLDAKRIRTIQDLKTISPSVYIQADQFQQDTVNVTIRGLRNYPSNSIQFDSATAIYVDGVYLARTQGLTGSLFDVDRIEVEKGPQGTLVGRNSTGGAILYSTMRPQDVFGGYLNLTGGDYGDREIEGALNIPITEKLAVRGAVSYTTRQGYLDNIYADPATGARNDTAALGYRRLAGRFSAKATPTDDFELIFRVDLSEEHDSGSAYHDLGFFVGTVPSQGRPSICGIPGTCNTVGGTTFTDLKGRVIAPFFSNVATQTINTDPRAYNALLNSVSRQAGNFWSTDQADNNGNTDHFQTYSLEAHKNFDAFDVKWLGSYRTYDSIGNAFSRGLTYDAAQFQFQVPDYSAYSSELTFNGSSFSDRLKWTAGFFYFREEANNQGSTTYLFSPNFPQPTAIAGRQVTLTDTTGNGGANESYAGYAQATYSILPELRFTAGVRYTIDERDANISSTSVRFPATLATNNAIANSQFNPGTFLLNGIPYQGSSTSCALTGANGKVLPANQCAFNVSKQFERPTWTLALDYDLFDHTLVYFTTRSGYRTGAINTGATNASVTVAQPETVQDYEVGIKSDWQIGSVPVRTNFALYNTDYQNIQVQVALPNATFASVPGGGPCTQAAFNSALCNGTTTDNVTLNAKSARIYGYEWDFEAKPIPELTLTYSGSYLHARYTDFTFGLPAGYLLPASGNSNLSGSPFPLPQWQMNAAATYTLTGDKLGLPVDEVALTANWYWQSKFLADFTGFRFPDQQAAGYGMTNFQVDVRNIAGSNLSLGAFVTNAFDKKACQPESGTTGGGGAGVLNSAPNATFGVAGTSGVLQCVPLAPRMFGFTARYKF
jgi:iron complex outermembrane receptor protein